MDKERLKELLKKVFEYIEDNTDENLYGVAVSIGMTEDEFEELDF